MFENLTILMNVAIPIIFEFILISIDISGIPNFSVVAADLARRDRIRNFGLYPFKFVGVES